MIITIIPKVVNIAIITISAEAKPAGTVQVCVKSFTFKSLRCRDQSFALQILSSWIECKDSRIFRAASDQLKLQKSTGLCITNITAK